MVAAESRDPLKMALPKGRMQAGVTALLNDAGVDLWQHPRSYRPFVSLVDCEVKLLKPQNIVEMLQAGSRDLGFTGADWVAELDADVVEVLDTGLDAVRLIAAAHRSTLDGGRLPERRLVVASEYERLARAWIADQKLDARFVHSYGATEVFPPEDADVIIDNVSTGATLQSNGLQIVGEVGRSSTRLYASRAALGQEAKRKRIDDLVLLFRAVLEARKRVMVEVNVSADDLESMLAVLPSMREPTVAPLAHADGFAVRAAIKHSELPTVIPALKAHGGTDVVVTRPHQIVP